MLIIGSGPVGSYAASLLAKKHDVCIVEEHEKVGEPVQCTGLLTHDIFQFLPKKASCIVNKIHDVEIFAPNGKSLDLHFKQPDIVVDRSAFDSFFVDKAIDSGARLTLNSRFLHVKKRHAIIKDLHSGKTNSLQFDNLIGADGPNSQVAKSAGLLKKRAYFTGIQFVVKKRNDNAIHFYPEKGGFGWAVPENGNTLRIGFASSGNPRDSFNRILKRYKGEILARQGGLIPIFDPSQQYQKDNLFLVGDAAGLVKATTGGGIIPGLRSAELIAESFEKRRDYQFLVRANINPSLLLNLKMRNVMDSFSEAEWNELVGELDSESAREAFENVNRDNLFSLAFKLAVSNPKLMKYVFTHLRALR